ncbi:MAG TPA: hypothetical protein VFJ74_03250 [Gemmatimonadaceae bacterium]|nr:hypothetical protein [Gemmatimonadaceae bacterium]
MTGNDATRRPPSAAALEAYLERLDAALAGAPASERREILLETRSHVLERTERSPERTVAEVLAELGTPTEYARQFLADDLVESSTTAASGARPTASAAVDDAGAAPTHDGVLLGLARLATGRWTRLPIFVSVVGAYAVAVFTFVLALGKLAEPHATGLFVRTVGSHRYVAIVWSDPYAQGRDVLGYWLVPLALLVSLAIHLAASALFRRLLRGAAPAL